MTFEEYIAERKREWLDILERAAVLQGPDRRPWWRRMLRRRAPSSQSDVAFYMALTRRLWETVQIQRSSLNRMLPHWADVPEERRDVDWYLAPLEAGGIQERE